MKTGKIVWLIGLAVLVNGAAFAAEQPQMTPEQQAQMEKMKALMAPSEAHKVLEPLAGKWTYTAKFWMDPSKAPEESAGTSEAEMIYGGRFLKETVRGTWMGEPFEGTGYTGHDNVKQEYQSVWIDGMGTAIMTSSGAYDAAAKTLKLGGTASCPLTGEKDMKMRSELKIDDADHHTLTGYHNGPDGKEVKGMEIVYTRA